MARTNCFTKEKFVDQFLKQEKEEFLDANLSNEKLSTPETCLNNEVRKRDSTENVELCSEKEVADNDFVNECLRKDMEEFLNEWQPFKDKVEKVPGSKDNDKLCSGEGVPDNDFVNEYLRKDMEEFLNEWHPFKDKEAKIPDKTTMSSSFKKYPCRCGFCDEMGDIAIS